MTEGYLDRLSDDSRWIFMQCLDASCQVRVRLNSPPSIPLSFRLHSISILVLVSLLFSLVFYPFLMLIFTNRKYLLLQSRCILYSLWQRKTSEHQSISTPLSYSFRSEDSPHLWRIARNEEFLVRQLDRVEKETAREKISALARQHREQVRYMDK